MTSSGHHDLDHPGNSAGTTLPENAVAQNQFQRALLNASIVSITDKAGNITFVNENFISISGYTHEELVGQNHRILNSSFHLKEFWVDMWKAISSGKVWRGEIKNKDKRGCYYWVETFIMPFTDQHGTIYEFLSVQKNITNRKRVEEELAAAHDRAHETLVFANIGTAELDATTGVLKVSKELAEIIDLKEPVDYETTVDEFFKAYVNETDHEVLYEIIKAGLTSDYEGKKRINVDFEIKTSTGRSKYIEAIGVFSHNNKVLGILQDVTQRRKIEHEREKAQIDAIAKGRQIERILFSITDGFFALDRTLHFTLSNPIFASRAGMSVQELLGKYLLTVFPELEDSEILRAWQGAMQTGESCTLEYESKRRPGHFFEITAYPNLEGIFVYYKDITDKKRIEQKLADEEQVLKNLANNLPNVIIYQYVIAPSGKGNITFISQALERITGYSVEAVMNNPSILEANIHEEDKLAHRVAVEKSIKDKAAFHSSYRLKCKDGTYRWLEARSALRQKEGDSLYYDGTLVDITEHRQLQHELVEQKSLLQGFFNASSDIKIMLDASCCYLSMNNAAQENLVNIFGVCPAVGDSAIPFIRAFSISQHIEKALRGEPVIVDQEYTFDGARKWNNMRFIPVNDVDGKLGSIVIYFADVTERNLALLEVEKSRTELRAILNASIDSIVFLDQHFKIITLNEAARKNFAQVIRKEPATGDNMLDYLVNMPELKARFIDHVYNVLKGQTIQKESQIEVNGNVLWLQVGYFPVRDSSNNIIGVSLNVKNVTARKRAESKLNNRDMQMRNAAVMANIGDWEVDLSTYKIYWSDEVCHIHEVEPGYSPDLATAINFYAPACQPAIKDAVRQCIEAGTSYDLQLEIVTALGKTRHIRTIGVCEIQNGKAVKLFGLFQDISKQKQIESELSKLAYIAKNTNNVVVITDKDGCIEWVNKAFEILTGYLLDEVKGKKPGHFLQGRETDKSVNGLVRNALKNKKSVEFEVLNYNKRAEPYWVNIQIEPVFNETGELTHFMAFQIDVTEKKYAEQMLKQQAGKLKQVNEQLMNLSENIPKGAIYQILITTDKQRHIRFISAGIEKLTGIKADDLIADATHFIKCIYHTDAHLLYEAENRSIENLSVLKLELRLRHINGTIFWAQANATPRLVPEGVLFDGFILDITERKTAEHELFQSKKHLESLVGSQTNYLIRLDVQGYYNYVNDRFLNQFKLKSDQLEGISFIHSLQPDDVGLAVRVMKACYLEPGKVVPVTLRSKSAGTECVWTEWEFVAIQDEFGKVINLQAVGFDATERVRSQQQLQVASSRLTLATKAAHLGVGEIDFHNKEIHLDEVLAEMLGIDSQREISMSEFSTLLHPTDLISLKHELKSIRAERPTWEGTFRITRPTDKKVCILRFYGTVSFDNLGKIDRLNGVALDVTKQETAFAIVQESEKRFRALADSAPVLIWMTDREGRYVYFNKSLINYTGLTPETKVGLGWLDCIHPDDLENYQRVFFEHLHNQKEFLFEFRLLRNDGQYRWMLGHGNPRYIENDLVVGFIGSCSDIHDRKETELKLIERNHEKDILIKEIHHRVKNNLQLISSIIFIRLNKMEHGEIRNFLEETRQKIHSIAMLHERLLQTEGLNKVDMESYLSKLLHNLGQASGLKDRNIEMKTDLEHLVFDIDVAIHCGLILNEMISNALKHAFKDNRSGIVYISLKRTAEGRSEFVIADNGIGLPEGIAPGSTVSFGMQLLEVSIKQLKAEVSIHRNAGTTFNIVF